MSCMLLYVFDMFHILLSGDSLRDLWNAYMYVCIYVCTHSYGIGHTGLLTALEQDQDGTAVPS